MTKDIDELRQLVQERREKTAERQAAAAAARGRERKRGGGGGGGGGKDERQQQQQDKGGSGNGPSPMDEDGAVGGVEIVGSATLAGHDGEVFTCAFSTTDPLVASG